MDDNGQKISVDINFADIQADKELGSNDRFILGNLFILYDVDTDFTARVYFKRDNGMNWESTDEYIVSKDEKRFFMPLPPGIVCIDAYPRINGDFKGFLLTSCKLFVEPIKLGKYGG